jgi:hypothetical protein
MIVALTRILGREPTEAEKENFEAAFAKAFSEPLPPPNRGIFNRFTGSWETDEEIFGQ